MLRFISLCFTLAALPQAQVLAQSSTGCESMQTEEEYQKCIERSGKPREMNPQIFGQGNSNVPANQPLQQDIMDALPPESQRHVRSEMAKKVYAEVGEWTPEARGEEFDYEPSAAAKGDPELRAEEEAVFAAAVSDYHDREQIAYEERQSGGANVAVSGDINAPETAAQPASRAGRGSAPGQSRSAMDILGDLNVADNDGGGGALAEEAEDDAASSASEAGKAIVVGDLAMGAPEGEDRETGQPAGATGSEMQETQETQPGQNGQTDENVATADADITDAVSPEDTGDTGQLAQDAAGQEQQDVAENAGIPGPAGEERSAQDIFGELSEDDAPGGDAQSSQTQSTETQNSETQSAGTQSAESQDEQSPGTQNDIAQTQSDTQTQTASNGSPSSQRKESKAGSSPPPAPTRPIPKTDAISAQFLSSLFQVENDREPATSAAPFADWSNPDTAERDTIETAAQTVLETPEDPETPIEPTTPSQSVRVLEKEAARLALQAQTGDAGPSEQASLEAEIAEGQAALQTLTAASEAELAPPPAQVTNRLAILGLP